MNKAGLELIKRHEGCKLEAYKCPAGVWTIGYGHTQNVMKGDRITQQLADDWLAQDLKKFEAAVLKRVKTYINENQIAALTSFAYNVGVGAFEKSTLLKMVNVEAKESVIRGEFAKWTKAGGKELPGLVRRRKDEADLYFKPIESSFKCNMK